MNRHAWVMMASFGLALCVAVLGGGKGRSADDDDEEFKKDVKDAGTAIIKLVDTMNKTGNGKKEAEAIHTKFGEKLKPVMTAAFKPRKLGGIGAGDVDANDGVETRINKWDSPKSRPLSPADITKQKATLERVAEVSRGMADVAEEFTPKKEAGKWKKFNDAMRKSAEDLAKATKDVDAAAVKRAITNLHGSCTDCHGEFRDVP